MRHFLKPYPAGFLEAGGGGAGGERVGGSEGTGDPGAVGTTLSPVTRLANAGGVQHSVSLLRKVQ